LSEKYDYPKNGKMDHEWLFWDNQDFMNQIGLGAK
jgi:hypothetical protein